ncbi:MAG: FAD-dependent oxidoreductase [Planctomycetes bacterium]|nr:FAD-dependent oxidoreductase [Planctomycetota bacterium]
MSTVVALDVVILGGGAAGLWLLDELHRDGHRALLLEASALGSGQTIASQGIIHGGLKYTLSGLLTSSARAIRDMPLVWRRCLAGERSPDLAAAHLRAEYCVLWQTTSLSSRIGMLGARAGLRVTPRPLLDEGRPEPLRDCPGVVARLDEQVIDPESFLTALSDRHHGRVLRIDLASGLEFDCPRPGEVERIRLINPDTGDPLDLVPRHVVLTAGAGNDPLRHRLGLEGTRMQLRPLHMVAARGPLPALNGHCVDGMHTRATITSARDYANRTIWQIGGQIAEEGVTMDPDRLVRRAQRELGEILPGWKPPAVEWMTYSVDRAEPATRGGRRPTDAAAQREGRTITAWPTKLALAPLLAERVGRLLSAPAAPGGDDLAMLADWPRPAIATPPWEECRTWITSSWERPASA